MSSPNGIAIGIGISHIFPDLDGGGGPITSGFILLEGSVVDAILMEATGDFILQQ